MIIDALYQMAQFGVKSQYPQGFSVSYDEAATQARRLAPSLLVQGLSYTVVEDRDDNISETYARTFEWVWQEQRLQSPLVRIPQLASKWRRHLLD